MIFTVVFQFSDLISLAFLSKDESTQMLTTQRLPLARGCHISPHSSTRRHPSKQNAPETECSWYQVMFVFWMSFQGVSAAVFVHHELGRSMRRNQYHEICASQSWRRRGNVDSSDKRRLDNFHQKRSEKRHVDLFHQHQLSLFLSLFLSILFHPGLTIPVGAAAALLALVLSWAAESPSGADMRGHPQVSIRPPHVAYTCKWIKWTTATQVLVWHGQTIRDNLMLRLAFSTFSASRWGSTRLPNLVGILKGERQKCFRCFENKKAGCYGFCSCFSSSSRSEHKAVPWWQDRKLEGAAVETWRICLLGLLWKSKNCHVKLANIDRNWGFFNGLGSLRFLRLGPGGIDLTSWIVEEWKQMGESCFHSELLFNFFLGQLHALDGDLHFSIFCTVCVHQDHSTWDELVGHAQISLSRWSDHLHWDRKDVAMNPSHAFGIHSRWDCEKRYQHTFHFSAKDSERRESCLLHARGQELETKIQHIRRWQYPLNLEKRKGLNVVNFIIPRTENDW